MLTVKHVDRHGHETMKTFVSVSFDRDSNTLTAYDGAEKQEWSSGRVFVMNENGQTVGAYNLAATSRKQQ